MFVLRLFVLCEEIEKERRKNENRLRIRLRRRIGENIKGNNEKINKYMKERDGEKRK